MRIKTCKSKIEKINESVVAFFQHIQTGSEVSETLEEREENLSCDKCAHITKNAKSLREHIVKEHTVNIFQGLRLETQSNNLVAISLEDTSDDPLSEDITCTKCDYITNTKNGIEEHMKNIHTVQSLKCIKCDYESETEDNLKEHDLITHTAEVISSSLHTCPTCRQSVQSKEQKLQCDKCFFFYHKSCTNRKSKGGKTPKVWKCLTCLTKTSNLDPHAPTFSLPQLTSSESSEIIDTVKEASNTSKVKQPTLTGKHRKSTLCDHPDVGFLEMQIDTLKGALAKKELEYTKLKQSDTLKAKQIINLESQLQESMRTLTQKNDISTAKENSLPVHVSSDGSFKLHFLENRTSQLEHQLGLLSAKMDAMVINTSTSCSKSTVCQTQPMQVRNYLCSLCDYECNEKNMMKEHITRHNENSLQCHKCDFKTMTQVELRTHKTEQHPPIIHT